MDDRQGCSARQVPCGPLRETPADVDKDGDRPGDSLWIPWGKAVEKCRKPVHNPVGKPVKNPHPQSPRHALTDAPTPTRTRKSAPAAQGSRRGRAHEPLRTSRTAGKHAKYPARPAAVAPARTQPRGPAGVGRIPSGPDAGPRGPARTSRNAPYPRRTARRLKKERDTPSRTKNESTEAEPRPQLPDRSWISGKNRSFQDSGAFLIVPISCMNCAYGSSRSGVSV